MCPIEWHQYEWPWVTLNVTSCFYIYLTPTNITALAMLCVQMNGKIYGVFNCNCFPKMKHFSRLGPLQAVTCTVKVVVSKKCCKIDTLLLHTTDRKYHIAYRFWPFPVTLDDLEVIRLLQVLSNAVRRKLCDISYDFNWHGDWRVARSLGDSWASCFICSAPFLVAHRRKTAWSKHSYIAFYFRQ